MIVTIIANAISFLYLMLKFVYTKIVMKIEQNGKNRVTRAIYLIEELNHYHLTQNALRSKAELGIL